VEFADQAIATSGRSAVVDSFGIAEAGSRGRVVAGSWVDNTEAVVEMLVVAGRTVVAGDIEKAVADASVEMRFGVVP